MFNKKIIKLVLTLYTILVHPFFYRCLFVEICQTGIWKYQNYKQKREKFNLLWNNYFYGTQILVLNLVLFENIKNLLI